MKYQPSNGTEGEYFMSQFCYQCIRWPHNPDAKRQCMIALNSMAHSINDPEYPKQWRYVDDKPCCTAFRSRAEYNRNRVRKCTDKHSGNLF